MPEDMLHAQSWTIGLSVSQGNFSCPISG